jgi:hypothetical protein
VHNHVIGAGAWTKTTAGGGGGSARTEEERRIAGRSSVADGIQETEAGEVDEEEDTDDRRPRCGRTCVRKTQPETEREPSMGSRCSVSFVRIVFVRFSTLALRRAVPRDAMLPLVPTTRHPR